MPQAADFQTAAQTDTVLVAAPGAGKRIEVLALVQSSDTAMTITWKSSTTATVDEQYAAANGGKVMPLANQPWFVCAANETLTYTTSSAGKTAVDVIYRIVTL